MLNEMEECGPVECDKYAFLLGSALRNSDQESFFTVYDSILPKNIPKLQLHWIKERARYIAELPEGEFNDWVVDARSFSLAPGKSKMSRSTKTATVSVADLKLSDDDDEISGPYLSMSSSSRLHKHGSQTDSGRPATISRKNSLSSEMSEEARGVYDYYPKYSDSVKIQDLTGTCPEYDEAIDVESDKSSVESPRSEDSGKGEYNVTQPDEYGTCIELKTYSLNRQGYHASDEDSDDNYPTHKHLYGSHRQSQYAYKRLEEDKEEYERATSFDQSSKILPRYQVENRKVTAVDAGTSFPLSRTEPSFSKSYSTGSRTEEWNMKQKKSRAIDESGVWSGFDVNGNPIEKFYSQMRERPLNQEASAFNSGNGYKNYGTTSSDNTLSNPISPQEPSHGAENKTKIGNKKGKQKREEPVVLAENVENYQGHKDLEELVKFIEQNDIKENQVKKSNGSSDVKVNDKLVKKAKDKKSKQTVGIIPSVPKPGDHIVIDIELELPPPPIDVMGNSSEKLSPTDEIVEKNIKPQDSDKSLSHKNKALIENDVKSKNKTSKNETTPNEKKPRSTTPGKKEVKEAKVNGFNHGVENFDTGVTKEIEKKPKESTKKPTSAKTPDSVNDKKKANKLQIDTTNDKQMVICSKSPGEMKSPLPTSPVSTKSEANDFDSGNYIFTDIPVSHVEPEFTIVNKKKKKPIAHVIQSKDQLPFMAGISREFPVTRPKYRENYSQSVPRSVTPPPTKSSRDKSQDFSLSSFPALSNSLVSKDKSNQLETRRSSIGDLPLAGETSSLDDSDIASVRSLPAAQAGRLLELASSRFHKSYAIIAASSKPVGQTSPDTSYEEYSGESPEKPKQTVWKGSLTERRHSIGSSPDDGKLLESSSGLTDSSRQKSGSQEVIKTENNPTSKTSDTANINISPSSGVSKQNPYHQEMENSKNQTCDKLVNTETSKESNVREGSIPHQTAEPNNQSELSQPTMSSSSVSPSKYDIPIQPFDVSRFDRKSTNKSTASSSAHAVVNRSPVSFAGNSVVNMRQSPARSEQVETSVSSVNIKSSSPFSSNDMRSQSVVPVTSTNVSLKSVKNKTLVPKIPTNGRKNKSVVFLDKRDVPSNLDITFGFDDITESKPTLTNNIEDTSAKNNTTSVKHKSTPKNDPEIVPTNVSVSQPNSGNVVTPTYVVNPSDLLPGHVFTQTLLEKDKQGGHIVPNYNTVKSLKDHVNLLNGVVKDVGQRAGNQQQTLTNETPNGNRSTVSTPQTNPNESNVPISHVNQPIVGKEKIMCSPVVENNTPPSSTVVVEDKKMVIYYGDAVVNDGDCVHSGGDNHTKSIQFLFSSKNINCGKFNHNEAVTQLKKEWDRVMELKSKNPGSVQVYSCQ